MNPERLFCLPVETIRLAGRLVLWATEKAVPMKPVGMPANIDYLSTIDSSETETPDEQGQRLPETH